MGKVRILTALLAVLVPAAGTTSAEELGQFVAEDLMYIERGETHHGDVYVFAGETRISGVQDGDLIAWTGAVMIDGEVTGDVIAGANVLDVSGTVGDTVRFFGSQASVSGTIDGDLFLFGGGLRMAESGHVTGNVVGCTGRVEILGTIDGDVALTGGEIEIDGTVGGSARVEADTIRLGSAARIEGDLNYKSRRELELADGATVVGETIKAAIEKPDETKSRIAKVFGFAYHVWSLVSALVVGLVLVAIFRRVMPAVAAPVGGDTLMSALIGFGVFLVVPAAALVAILLVITLPLGLLVLVTFGVGLYLAKMPVALWVGRWLLQRAGRVEPSPSVSLVLGIVIIYLLAALPYYVGTLIWLAVTWLGLGAIILSTRKWGHYYLSSNS